LGGRHAIVHHFLSKLLGLFGRFAHVPAIERWLSVVFDDQLDRFGPGAASNFAC